MFPSFIFILQSSTIFCVNTSDTEDTFCRIFHSECPEFNLIDAYQRGRVNVVLFGEGDMTGQDVIQNFERYFLMRIRGGQMDQIISTRIQKYKHVNDVKKAISDIFHNIIGTSLEKVGFWTVVTERIRCKIQFQIKDFTELKSRRNLKVNNIGSISRIRKFRRTGKGVLGVSNDDILNPKLLPMGMVKREADMEEITAYNTSLKGRRRRRARDEQTMKLRAMWDENAREITEVCWIVLIGFDPSRKKEALLGLQKNVGMSMDDAKWAMKWGVPYFLLKAKNPDMSLEEGRKLETILVECGLDVMLERQYDS